MASKLFIGNLSWNTTDDSLKDFFAQAGTVTTATVLKDKFTGRSRGFGFVEMSSDEEAKKAIDELNGKELDGRPIVVNEARPMVPRENRGGGGGYQGGGSGYRGGGGGYQGGGGYRAGGGGGHRGGRGGGHRPNRDYGSGDDRGGRDW